MPSNLTQAAICGPGQKMGVNPCITGISPTALKIAAALPKPNLPGLANGTVNNLNNVVQNYTHGNQGDVKSIGRRHDKDHFLARYSQQHVENPTVNSETLPYSGDGSNIFPAAASGVRLHAHADSKFGERFSRRHELLPGRRQHAIARHHARARI